MKTYFLFFWLIASLASQAQVNETLRDILNGKGGTLANPNGSRTVFGVKSSQTGKILGDVYLDTTWHEGNIKLYQKIGPLGREGDSIPNVPVRYDIYLNEIEIMANNYNDIRAVEAQHIQHFEITQKGNQRFFVNMREFESDESKTGFVERTTNGKLKSYLQTKIKIIKPTYNEALNTGSRDAKILKEQLFFIVEGKKLIRLSPSKKKLLELMSDKTTQIEAFAKEQELNYRDINDAIRLLQYYNNLR
jgi:hypothetical protein